MTPWTAALLAAAGTAILLQWGRPPSARVWGGCFVAALVGAIALVFLAEYATGTSLWVDRVFFSEAVSTLQSTWPGRPSPQTAITTLLLSIAVVLIRLDRLWTRVIWPLCLAAASVIPLVNRAEAIGRLETALSDSQAPEAQLGVLFCDIDQFKDVNDTWGHTAGDFVLATLATRIRECLRQGDTVGRMGGDEMLVLLPEIHDLDEVCKIAEKIRSCAAEPIYYAGHTIHPTLSIGATVSERGRSPSAVIARADVAMYRAKEAGRNVVVRIEETEDGSESVGLIPDNVRTTDRPAAVPLLSSNAPAGQ